MISNKPIVVPPERNTNRQTCIILSVFGSVLCILFLAVGVLSWPLVKESYPSIAARFFPPAVSPWPSRPTASAGPTATPLPGYVPHRIGVRLVDGVAEFYDRVTGEKFVPRGYNYVLPA